MFHSVLELTDLTRRFDSASAWRSLWQLLSYRDGLLMVAACYFGSVQPWLVDGLHALQCWPSVMKTINQSIISAVHATAGRWPPQLGCGVEPRNPPRWFRAAWWARQLSLRVDSLAMRQVVWGYILPIAGPKQNLWPDLTHENYIFSYMSLTLPAL